MGQFLYFLPGVASDVEAAMAAAGLSDRVDGKSTSGCQAGPGGTSGMLISGTGGRNLYRADDQTWAGPFNDGKLWIGFWTDDRPTPNDLKRPSQVDGSAVTLNDGAPWLIPTATAAPFVMTVRDGEVHYEALALAERLWAHVEKIKGVFKDSTVSLTDLELLEIIADALAVNYRVSADPAQEVTLLKLCSTENFKLVTNAILDVALFDMAARDLSEDAKKKDGSAPG